MCPSEDWDQTADSRSLIWPFTGRTCPKLHVLTMRLILLASIRSTKTQIMAFDGVLLQKDCISGYSWRDYTHTQCNLNLPICLRTPSRLIQTICLSVCFLLYNVYLTTIPCLSFICRQIPSRQFWTRSNCFVKGLWQTSTVQLQYPIQYDWFRKHIIAIAKEQFNQDQHCLQFHHHI